MCSKPQREACAVMATFQSSGGLARDSRDKAAETRSKLLEMADPHWFKNSIWINLDSIQVDLWLMQIDGQFLKSWTSIRSSLHWSDWHKYSIQCQSWPSDFIQQPETGLVKQDHSIVNLLIWLTIWIDRALLKTWEWPFGYRYPIPLSGCNSMWYHY